VHTARAQGCKSQWLCDKHNCPQRDSIPGPRALQSGMLPLVECLSGRRERRMSDGRYLFVWVAHFRVLTLASVNLDAVSDAV